LVREKRRLFEFDSLPWQRPLKNQKKLNKVSKPLHLSTNSEILVKIEDCSISVSATLARKSTIKKNLKKLEMRGKA